MENKGKLLLFGLKALDSGYSIPEIQDFIAKRFSSTKQNLGQNISSGVNNLAGGVQDLGDYLGSILSQAGPITQAFGNYNPALYRGINKSMTNTGVDIGVPTGTKVSVPPGKWVVEEASSGNGFNKGYGNSVVLKNTDTGEKLRFSHLSQVGVAPGQLVKAGKVLGLTGATGNVTGPHLDLEYYNKLGQVADFLKSQYARFLE